MTITTQPALPNESVYCSVVAATRYNVPANLMLAVAETESGSPGLWRRNTDGTSDVGPMQFNTGYLASLSRYGITPQAVAQSGCYSFALAAWRISRHLTLDQGDIWQRAANYHSRSLRYNARYRAVLMVKAAGWAEWLSKHAVVSSRTAPTRPNTTRGLSQAPDEKSSPSASGYTPRMIVASDAR